MPYRSASTPQSNDAAVACARCAALTSMVFAEMRDGEFRCASCQHEQPVLRRAEDLACETIRLADQGAVGSYEELRPFARDLGKDVPSASLHVVCDGIGCQVGLSINSGTVMGVDLLARGRGLPEMRFVTEDPSHVEAKASGVVREVQTGDGAFDETVYVESAASDPDILVVLSSPAVRAAIRELLRDSDVVTIREENVTVYVRKERAAFDSDLLRKRLGLMRVVAGAPRPLVAAYVPVPARVLYTKTIFGLAAPVSILSVILGLSRWTPTGGAVFVVSLVAGLFLFGTLAPIYTLLLRGRSTSHRDILVLRVATFFFAPVLMLGLLLIVNGAFDASPERIVKMKVTEVTKDDDDDALLHVKTVDDDGNGHDYQFKGRAVALGAMVEVGWRKGALGFTWESRDATVLITPSP